MSEIMTANTILAPGPAWFNPYFLLLGEQKQKELCNWYLFEDGKVIASFKWPDDEHRDNDQRVPMTLEEPTIRKRSVDLSSRTPFYVPCDCEYKLEQKQGHLYVPTSLLPIRQDLESVTELVGQSQIPRDAAFASDQVILDTLDVIPLKYGLESRVSWEDTQTAPMKLPERTTIRVGNRVARLVNTVIWNALTQNQSATTIRTLATAATWNNATR